MKDKTLLCGKADLFQRHFLDILCKFLTSTEFKNIGWQKIEPSLDKPALQKKICHFVIKQIFFSLSMYNFTDMNIGKTVKILYPTS